MAKARKSLFSQLSKQAREDISRIMRQMDGELPLHEFLAKRWNHKAFWHRPQLSAEGNAQMKARRIQDTKERFPQFTDEQIDLYSSFFAIHVDLREVAIARRIVLEDPAEMARGLALNARLYRLLWSGIKSWVETEVLIEQCAIRQADSAAVWVQGYRAGKDAIIDTGEVLDIGYVSILQRNWKALRVVASRPADEKSDGFVEALYTYLLGLDRGEPALVANGLNEHLLSIHRMRNKDGLSDAVNLAAQGLYRLAEWIDPVLVSEFDVDQPRPWDAEFHHYCQEHPDPLADMDLSPISPELHDVLIRNQLPEWLPKGPDPTWEVVLTGMGEQTNFERGMAQYRRAIEGFLHDGPVVIRWNQPRKHAEHVCKEYAGAGGITEIRPTSGPDYRLFSWKRGRVTEWGR